MRHPSIPIPVARATFAALLGAATLAAQSPAGRSVEPRLDADSGEVIRRWTPPEVDLRSFRPAAGTALQQGEDAYSVSGLFSQLHGEFMQKGFAFRNNLRLAYGMQTETEISGENLEFDFHEIRGEVFAPFTLDPDMLLIAGAAGGVRRYEFTSTAGGPGIEEDLYETAVHLGLGRFLSEDFYVEAVFRPGVYTDYGGTLHGDDWQFYGDVIGTYRFDPGFYGKVGVVYDGTFDDLEAYPVLGFALLLSETVRVDMLLPKQLELAWMPDPSWILKAGLSLDGETYHGRLPTELDPTQTRYDVRTQEMRLYVDATMRFDDHFSIYGRGGATLLGDYQIEVPGSPATDGSVDPAPFFEVGFGINF